MKTQKPLFTVRMITKETGIPRATLHEAIRAGNVKGSFRAGCYELFTPADVERVKEWRNTKTKRVEVM
jgi:hypothetical protein